MTIESLATKDVVALDERCNAQDAARAMRDRRVGSVVVTQGSGRSLRLVGIVTDRDIAMALAADDLPPTAALGDFARRPLVTVSRTTAVTEAARIMHAASVRRLVLVDDHRHMVGIVSLDDMLGDSSELIAALVGAARSGGEHDGAPGRAATSAPESASTPLLISPDLQARWRHMVR